jgi:hypothetical protein
MSKRSDGLSWAEYNAAKYDPVPSHKRGRPDPAVIKRLGINEPVPTTRTKPEPPPEPMEVEESFMDTIRMAAFKFLGRDP